MPHKENKFWKWLNDAGRWGGWMWLLLISCSAIFLFPFAWMISSSIKTDEEVNAGNFLPEMPEFRSHSPYVIEAPEVKRPPSCSENRWKRILPRLLDKATQHVRRDATRPQLLNNDVEDEHMVEQASQYLVQRGINKMAQQIWAEPDDQKIEQAFQTALNAGGGVQAELRKAYAKVHARMILHGVKVRARGEGVVYHQAFHRDTVKKTMPDGLTTPDNTSGKLEYDTDGELVLRSHFASSSDQPVVVTYQFQVDRPADEIYRIIVPITHDASWHQVHADLKINGVSYQGTRSEWLAQNRSSALILQVTGNDEEFWGKRPWIPMHPVDSKTDDTPSHQSHITLTLTLDPSSTAAARYGKVTRNYRRIFLSMPFWKYVINSVLITVLSIIGAVLSSCFVAYAFARLKWPGRSIAFLILLSTMMLPPQVTMIPQFLIWREIGWYNTLNPIWVPTWFGVAFFIFLMVQQMKTIPRDLEEAAEIDGMNRLQIWWYVILPLVKPAMAAIAIMSFMASWNEFMQPLIYLRDMGRFPLSVGIYAMGADDTMSHDMSFILAGNLLMTLPVIVIFFFFQRYFIQGVASAGVKG